LTGVVQSALSNLPELFVCLFAVHAGLYDVARAALVGSILANVLVVLGLAFVVGGLRHGPQRFNPDAAKLMSLMLGLSSPRCLDRWSAPPAAVERRNRLPG
jgi:Ca2+:H+ antiporter